MFHFLKSNSRQNKYLGKVSIDIHQILYQPLANFQYLPNYRIFFCKFNIKSAAAVGDHPPYIFFQCSKQSFLALGSPKTTFVFTPNSKFHINFTTLDLVDLSSHLLGKPSLKKICFCLVFFKRRGGGHVRNQTFQGTF